MKKTALLLALMTSAVSAAEVNLDLLKKSLNPTSEIKQVQPAPIKGLFEVQINNEIVYLTADGQYVISGDVYNLKTKTSLTDSRKNGLRTRQLSQVADKDKIIYKAKDEKYKVRVFTDITCPYCTKIHKEIADYNEAGITVEYLAFPRAGVGSKAQKDMQKIWCAENKTLALTNAKINGKLPKTSCDANQVTEQFLMGVELGVNATPTIILADGEVLPGYYPAKQLIDVLKQKAQ